MSMPHEIGLAGERFVVEWLRNKGYSIIRWDTASPGSTDIEANSGNHLLVQVKTAVYPNEPLSLSSDDVRNIKSRATRIGAYAWEGEIMWRKNPPQIYNG